MDKAQFEILTKKLDSITHLLAFSIVKDKPVSEQIKVLTKTGLKASEIALLLDKTENQVYVTQTMLRKNRRNSEKPAKEEDKQDD